MAGSDFGFTSNDELREVQQARAQRKAEFIEVIKKAGLDPDDINVSMVMADETQVTAIRQAASRKEAYEMARLVGRQGLREQLKKTVAEHEAKIVEDGNFGSKNGSQNGSMNGRNGTH